MSLNYVAVQWNRQKRIYDSILAGSVGLFLLVFMGVTKIRHPLVTDEILLIRAFGTGALVLLHVILCLGPLARLDRRFLPLLYNRRHAGVTCCLMGLIHAGLILATYHAGGDANPIVNIFTSTPWRASTFSVPFQAFGAVALFILVLMASTSHDFWLANLSAPVWKTLHMLVYAAYALLIAHVTFGVLQAETHPVMALATGAGVATVVGLHLAAGLKEKHADDRSMIRRSTSDQGPAQDGYVPACRVEEIPEKRARIVHLSGERVAIFKYDGQVSAVSNVCQHQNGPLGEGRIVNGCITCPWHGYQYHPDTGASPPPFVEKVPTFRVRLVAGTVWIHPQPLPAGTRVAPARIETSAGCCPGDRAGAADRATAQAT